MSGFVPGESVRSTCAVHFGGGRELPSGSDGVVVGLAADRGAGWLLCDFAGQKLVLNEAELSRSVIPFVEQYRHVADAEEDARLLTARAARILRDADEHYLSDPRRGAWASILEALSLVVS